MMGLSGTGATAKVSAKVNLDPKASQIFLISSVALSALSMLCGTYLFSIGNSAAWLLVILAALIAAGAFGGWWKSQADVDLQSAKPTTIKLPNGSSITTDSRTLHSDSASNNLRDIFEVAQRKVLPIADGLVQDGAVVAGSGGEAIRISNAINEKVAAQLALFNEIYNRANQGAFVSQSQLGSSAPSNDGLVSKDDPA